MISSHTKAGRPHVVAVFSYRYDAHLVPALLANIDPLVDGWVAYDDRGSTALFSNEVHRRTAVLNVARDVGASWALAVDPDERFETGLASELRTMTSREGCAAYTFALREMYAPDVYRVDGVWGQKRQARLLSLGQGVVAPTGDLHLSWASFIPTPNLHNTDFNLYHLKMITPERRAARAALYNRLDPSGGMQTIGYDYLADDEGAQFERIPNGREYHPLHEEDGGLWMPPLT